MVWATSGKALQTGGAFSATTSSVAVSVASSGGSTTGGTAITIAQMPAHNHSVNSTSLVGNFGNIALQWSKSNGSSFYANGICKIYDTGSQYASLPASTYSTIQDAVYIDATHAHTTNNNGSGQAHTHSTPNHTHTLTNGTHSHTISNIMPPYITAYCWYRTA